LHRFVGSFLALICNAQKRHSKCLQQCFKVSERMLRKWSHMVQNILTHRFKFTVGWPAYFSVFKSRKQVSWDLVIFFTTCVAYFSVLKSGKQANLSHEIWLSSFEAVYMRTVEVIRRQLGSEGCRFRLEDRCNGRDPENLRCFSEKWPRNGGLPKPE
jgi:hypothetical protein